MKDPCTICEYCKIREEGHRRLTLCSDGTMKKGFLYDDWTYQHTCKNQKIKEQCKKCNKFSYMYCNNVYVDCRFEEKSL